MNVEWRMQGGTFTAACPGCGVDVDWVSATDGSAVKPEPDAHDCRHPPQ